MGGLLKKRSFSAPPKTAGGAGNTERRDGMAQVIADIAIHESDRATAAHIALLKDAGILTPIDALWTLKALPEARQALADPGCAAYRVALDGGRDVRLCRAPDATRREVGRGVVEKVTYGSAEAEIHALMQRHQEHYGSSESEAR